MALYYNEKDSFMQEIVQQCATLHEEYQPPWYCFNGFINFLVLIFKSFFRTNLPMKRDLLHAPDKGIVSIDWANDDVSKGCSADAPILAIMHTLTGSSKEQSEFMRYAASRGWRSCVLNRRGHSGMSLTTSFNIMGNVDDSVLMINHIRQLYPKAFLCVAGVSAGSGQLVSYVGREGPNSKVDAAAVLCPAWDLEGAFMRLQKCSPFLDRYLTDNVKAMFLRKKRNKDFVLQHRDTVEKCLNKTYLVDFMRVAYPLAGYSSYDEYMKRCNPLAHCLGNTTPLFVLNSLDDNICRKENIRYDLKDDVRNTVLKVTRFGGHIAYNEHGYPGNFMWRISLDYFEAVRKVMMT